jgi:hypothetical protein
LAVPALLLAHVLADFALQADWMVRAKQRGPLGVIPHILVVALMTLLAIAPQWQAWLPAALIVIATHTVIDVSKIELDRRMPKRRLQLFFLDQFLHLLIIVLVSLTLMRGAPALWDVGPHFWVWSAGLTLSMFVVSILMRVIYGGRRRFPARWWSVAEQGAITALTGAGLVVLAPLAPLVRLGLAHLRQTPLDTDARFEMAVGDTLALLLGLLVFVTTRMSLG